MWAVIKLQYGWNAFKEGGESYIVSRNALTQKDLDMLNGEYTLLDLSNVHDEWFRKQYGRFFNGTGGIENIKAFIKALKYHGAEEITLNVQDKSQ